ncbi:reverse transcriptase domain-containing protein, partial [Acinetobacter baumannii]|uniref:reverse transcriptase domain-containing protein n=1 Tax=Acinetobacter baumannii TaxID=470 RepID=UPI00324257B3
MFTSDIGLKQGCPLSPTLFNIYINDIEDYLNNSFNGIDVLGKKLSTLLFADDLIVLAETAEDLQRQLDKLYDYCQIWKLNVNLEKSNIMIFNKRGILPNEFFWYGDREPGTPPYTSQRESSPRVRELKLLTNM